MTGLPIVACPVCGTRIPLEVWIACTATREAFTALAKLHPSQRLPWTAMRYAALFGPAKQTMRWERIADVLREIGELISTGRVEWKHQTLAAPLDYWLNGMEALLAKTDLRRPLANHNYLKAVVAGMSDQAAAQVEQRIEQTRQGVAGTGGAAARAERTGKTEMPTSIREQLKQATIPKGAK